MPSGVHQARSYLPPRAQVPAASPHADADSLVHGLLNVRDLLERRVDLWINNFPGATHLLDVYSNRRVDKRRAFPSQYTRLQHLQELHHSSPNGYTVRAHEPGEALLAVALRAASLCCRAGRFAAHNDCASADCVQSLVPMARWYHLGLLALFCNWYCLLEVVQSAKPCLHAMLVSRTKLAILLRCGQPAPCVCSRTPRHKA
jgi:hypothetical protein